MRIQINTLLEEKQYDEIRTLAEKYRDVVVDIEFTDIIARIAEPERMENDRYIYFPNGNGSLNGTEVGVYTYGENGYFFYFGAIKNGTRKETKTI